MAPATSPWILWFRRDSLSLAMVEKRDKNLREEASDGDDDDAPAQTEERDRELSGDEAIETACLKLYAEIEKGFADQWERGNAQMDYWDIYHCLLGPKQFYSGNSKIFLPIVHDAVNARKTRFVNQIFPQSGKHIDVIAAEDKPTGLMSLLEFYIRKARLRTNAIPALVRNGDIEGQYNLYIRWVRNERHVAMRVKKKRKVDDLEIDGDDYDDIVEQKIVHQYPVVEVIADADVLVLPATASSIEDAIDQGGSVTIIRRWSKTKIRQLIRDGEIDKESGQALLKGMAHRERQQIPDKQKNVADSAGIKNADRKATALVYETWSKLKVDGERRIVRIYFGGDPPLLGCKLNPYWCDKVPLLSSPVEKVEGAFKGVSKIKFVETMQYAANDAVNEGMDSAAYALLPIILTDPEKNPRVGSMVLNVAAVWETSPKDTQFAQFPQLWKEAFGIVGSCKDQIFQTLGVNPAMMPQQVTAPGKKPNQAQIANEQQVDMLTTADAVTSLEGEILTPMLQWFVWLDHQFRDDDMTIPAFGDLGIQMVMDRIEPIQMDRRFEFRWFGVEQARNQQQMQMQMAGLNMLKGIPPNMFPGYRIQLAPVISNFVENVFGPRLAPRVFEDVRKQLTLEPEFENKILAAGMPMHTHPLDNDAQHMQAHMKEFQESGDYTGMLRDHMMQHQMQMQQKQQAAQAAQQQAMQQPMPPQGQGPGGRGPRQGAAAQAPRGGQLPPGAVPRDQMALGPPRVRGAA
jgi:hypothetical protein